MDVFSVEISPSESFLHRGGHLTLNVNSEGHALHVFINGHLSGITTGNRKHVFSQENHC